MSDEWSMFFADMDGHPAMTTFNDGISKRINNLPHDKAVWISIKLKFPREDGLTTEQEFAGLTAFEKAVEQRIEARKGIYLGRITGNSKRECLGMFTEESSSLVRDLEKLAKQHDYDAIVKYWDDPEKAVYWKDLYPDADNRQAIEDLKVLGVFSEHNDISERHRDFDHFAIFSSKNSASEFASWLEEFGHKNIKLLPFRKSVLSKKEWHVKSQHSGPAEIGPISQHTIPLNRKANELGGKYDGWGATIVSD